MILLLALGIAVGALGLLATGFGIPIKDTTFGNSLMLGGATSICSGLILIGLALVVRELRALTDALLGGASAAPRPAAAARPGLPPLFPTTAPASHDGDYAPAQVAPPPASPQSPPPWASEAATRSRPPVVPSEHDAPPESSTDAVHPEPPPLAPLVMPPRPRRNLLFPSRKKDPGIAPEATAPADAPTSPPPAMSPEPRLTFDTAWPSDAATSANAPAPAAPPPPASPPPLPEGVTIIKSGVVDGMEYKLYSDGSIEAQMAEGMLRFASLDELRNYLAQRS